MAIEVEIIECANVGASGGSALPLLQGPITARQRLTAAGLSAALATTTTLVLIRNHGDAVHIRLNAAGVTTNAGTGDAASVKLRASPDELAFKINRSAVDKIDVRAA